MNPKIDKLARDIEKTEKKIADLQKKLELFKEEKTRLENEDYGDIGRDFHMTPKELAEFLKAHRAGTLTVPEAAPPALPCLSPLTLPRAAILRRPPLPRP